MHIYLMTLMVFICAVCPQTGEYHYWTAQQYDEHFLKGYGKHFSDPIPMGFSEKVLQSADGKYMASRVLFVVPIGYEEVKNKFIRTIEQRYGLESAREVSERFDESCLSGTALRKEQELKQKAETLGLIWGRFKGVHIISKSFNVKGESYSHLEMMVYDGIDILNKPYSFIEVRRKDHWIDWAYTATTRIWLPWKTMTFTEILTEGEIVFTEDTLRSMSPRFLMSYPGKFIYAFRYSDDDFMTWFAQDLKECEKTQKEQ